MKNMFNKVKKIILLFAGCLSFLFVASSCASHVNISQTEIQLRVDETVQLTAVSSDEDALVLWSTSDANVATVRRGNVTGRGKGTCYITAYDDNGAQAKCKVTVKGHFIELNRTYIVLDKGNRETYQLIATTYDGGEVTWSSADNNIATVSEDGLVTPYDIGNTRIIATYQGKSASCEVKIKDSALPQDYYKLESVTSESQVAANPGVWSYYNQGGSENVFTIPVHQNNSLSVKFSALTTGDKPLKLRYQPGGSDGSGVVVGDDYTISFTATINANGTLYYGINGASSAYLNANVSKSISYSGTVSSSVFAFSIKKISVPSDGLTVTISNIHVVKKETPTGRELELGTNATVLANPGVWYYHGIESSTKVQFDTRPAISAEGVLSVSIVTLHSETFYFRYQPGGSDGTNLNPGDQYTVTFVATLSVGGSISYGAPNAYGGRKTTALTAGETTSLTSNTLTVATSGVSGAEPFAISVPSSCPMPATLTVANIVFTKIS